MKKNLNPILILIFLISLSFLTFHNSLKNGFMLDDHFFFDNYKKNVKNIFLYFLPDRNKALKIDGEQREAYFRPFAHIIPMICHLTFKENVFGFHFVNMILLAIAGFLIFAFINQLFNNFFLGITTAILYIVHPLNGIMVNYITCSVYSAQVIFAVLCLMNWEKTVCHCEKRSDEAIQNSDCFAKNARNDTKNLLFCLFFFLLALWCHETSFVIPFLALAIIANERKERGNLNAENLKKLFTRYFPTLIIFIFAAIYFLFRLKFASINNSILEKYSEFHMSFPEYLASVSKLLFWYIEKFIYPAGIVIIWCTSVVRTHVGEAILGLITLMLIAGLFYKLLKNNKPARIGLAWLIAGFLPLGFACLFQPTRGLIIEPHWFVVPSIGFFLLVAAVLDSYRQKLGDKIILGLITLISFSWLIVSWGYNKLWSDEEKYCFYWLHEAPEYAAVNFHLGKYYELKKDFDRSEFYYGRAVTNHPKDIFMFTINKALFAINRGKWEEAKKLLQKAYALNPKSSDVLSNLGVIAYNEKDLPVAKKYFQEAVENNSFAILPRLNLATLAKKDNDPDLAKKLYNEVLDIDPDNSVALGNLMRLFMEAKNKDEAIKLAYKLKETNKSAEALTNIAIVFMNFDKIDEAEQCLQSALKINDKYSETYFALGILNEKLNNKPKALEYYKKGEQINPKDWRFHAKLKGWDDF